MSELLLGAVLAVTVIYLLISPFFRDLDPSDELKFPVLGEDRSAELRAEMELDRATGKLSEADYRELSDKASTIERL